VFSSGACKLNKKMISFYFSNRRSGSRKSDSKLGEDTVDSGRLIAAQPAAVPTKSSGQQTSALPVK
jgi:hypothetical protein